MTPSANEIMIAQSGESVGNYALKGTRLVYETIASSDAYSQSVTEYADTDFPFEDINYIRPTNWGKDQTDVVELSLYCLNTKTPWTARSIYSLTSREWMLPLMEDQTRCTAME